MKRVIYGSAIAGVLLVATAIAQTDNAAGPRGMMTQGLMMQACPMKVEGTTVTAADTATGIAVTFTAKPANVADLQARVERMANMHTAMSNAPGGQMHVIPGTVKYEALPTGARLTLTPNDASKLKEFREQVRSRVEKMKTGDCSMMQDMMMQGMMMGSAAKPAPKGK